MQRQWQNILACIHVLCVKRQLMSYFDVFEMRHVRRRNISMGSDATLHVGCSTWNIYIKLEELTDNHNSLVYLTERNNWKRYIAHVMTYGFLLVSSIFEFEHSSIPLPMYLNLKYMNTIVSVEEPAKKPLALTNIKYRQNHKNIENFIWILSLFVCFYDMSLM